VVTVTGHTVDPAEFVAVGGQRFGKARETVEQLGG
jgi:hypothetical protein